MQVATPMKLIVWTKRHGRVEFPVAQFAVSPSETLLVETPSGVQVFKADDYYDVSGEYLVTEQPAQLEEKQSDSSEGGKEEVQTGQ